jgi:hypothetical protein
MLLIYYINIVYILKKLFRYLNLKSYVLYDKWITGGMEVRKIPDTTALCSTGGHY